MLYVEVFCAPIQLKKDYRYTRNNCLDLNVLQKVLQPRPSKLLLAIKLHN